MVYTAEKPERLFVIASTLMHTVLQAVGEHLKPPDGRQFVAVPKVPPRSTYYLPVIGRYGLVNDTELNRVLGSVYSYRYRVNLDIGRSVRVEEINAAGERAQQVSGDLGGLLDSDVRQHALTLPELTLQGLGIRGRVVPRGVGRWEGEVRREMGFHAPVVVTGDKESVEDFVLYWNLRSEHFFAEPFPLWIPIELLDSADAFAAVERALERIRPGVGQTAPQMADVLITSASMGETELRERLVGRYSEASISTNDPIGLFAEACEYRYAVEKLPAQFFRGRASIQPPRSEELKKSLIPQVDRVAHEVGVDGVWLPQAEAMARHLGWLHSRDEISKWGNLRFVKPFNKEFSERDLLDLRTPDGWTLLRSIFEERGYDVAPTDKSRAALGQLALVGGVQNMKVLASSKVRELLRELSMGRGEGNAFVSERRTAPLARFDSELGRESGRKLLEWLIERRLLFRGAIIKCPRCELGKWYEVDRVAETWRCDGCKEDMPIPLHLQSTPWRYRINELYAHGHDQGTLTPLLTLYAMHTAWGASSAYGNLGFYPGVELKAKDGADVPFQHKEIDLVAMRGGDLILAECKESVDHLSDHGEAGEFAKQLGDLVVLADHLGASQLLVASSTPFPDDKESLVADVPSRLSVQITWLDGRDLLDPGFPLDPLRYPEVADRRIEMPEGWDEDYLDWVRRSITNQDA
jgi:hypothetical protein